MSRPLSAPEAFEHRHIGPRESEQQAMLSALGVDDIDALIAQVVPEAIRQKAPLELDAPVSEDQALREIRELADHNQVRRSLIGMGYYDTLTPTVIQRCILEDPGWYTQYTPYQSEIAQGRLEALLNYQTVICELTGLPIANSSLLDEGTAAAEAMAMGLSGLPRSSKANVLVVDAGCHPQTIDVVATRAEPLGIEVVVTDAASYDFAAAEQGSPQAAFGVLVQYPSSDGSITDWSETFAKAGAVGATRICATDLLALTLLTPPAEMGADICVGSSQRFGVPLGYGGPHAAFMSAADSHKRRMPGRIVGVSKDVHGAPAMRLALQTREQHIRRDRATSNICTAQVLLAVMASMYAVYHGPDGLKRIASRVRLFTCALADALAAAGFAVGEGPRFDTITLEVGARQQELINAAYDRGYNLRAVGSTQIGLSFDERTDLIELGELAEIFGCSGKLDLDAVAAAEAAPSLPAPFARQGSFLEGSVFHSYRSEAELTRYINRLRSRDLSLVHSMIPLGSCTMKLNAVTEMIPVTWAEFGRLHPYAPVEQAAGYQQMFKELEDQLARITGFAAVSLQPNAGSQGEYAGLQVIRRYHLSRGDEQRTICLIPSSAHGTNPASAVMVGMKVVVVACDDQGNIDVADLEAKAKQHADQLAALMVTYPSTHGVFEESIIDICRIVHEHGGQVYMDGANLNAQVGLCNPGEIGADVCHLNLHKTFCIPHGGGGPGMGPIACVAHLAPFLPRAPKLGADEETNDGRVGPISAANWGSASILPISYLYIRMMGAEGLTHATKVAILNANYIAARLADHFPVLYTGRHGRVAHECILDLRKLKADAGVEVEDVAKRLMDYGYHAPTVSWPVAGTIMVEPTESESQAELDRFCDALIAIKAEADEIASGAADREDNVLKNAPHTAKVVTADGWEHSYSREKAAFPAPWLRSWKFWPPVGRIDNVYGDRNLVCDCAPLEAYASETAAVGS